ncbi:amidase family protein [Mycobacterium kansasii]|uniref:amidase n=1 Tax=Mycobacterium kansasii TaxID=1768 RepID=A0A1V3X760_MYCKA|nr:amidase family protein [Mycobacterium kansasii]
MQLDEYLSLDATALAELVERKQVTPAELLALARQRADAVNPRLNAIVRRLDEVADRQAADPRLQGRFAGVPFLIKDLDQEYQGFPTSSGSRSLANDVADRHALITQRFLDAGLVIFGKTNTPEFGAKGVTEPEYWVRPATRGTCSAPRAARRADRELRSPPGSCRQPGPTTAAGRSASPPPATGSSASNPAAGCPPTARRPANRCSAWRSRVSCPAPCATAPGSTTRSSDPIPVPATRFGSPTPVHRTHQESSGRPRDRLLDVVGNQPTPPPGGRRRGRRRGKAATGPRSPGGGGQAALRRRRPGA